MNIAIEGRKYQGKSTLANYLAERIQKRTHAYPPVYFDPKWTFRSIPHTERIDDFVDMLEDADPHLGLAFRPGAEFSGDDTEKVREDFTSFCEAINLEALLRKPPERPIVVVIDEAYYLQKGLYVHPWLARTLRFATQHKIYLIQAVHRPVEIASENRGKIDQFFWFRQDDPGDLSAIREVASEEVVEIVSTLPKHHVLEFNVESRAFELWQHPELWYRDISEDFEEGDENERDNRVTIATEG